MAVMGNRHIALIMAGTIVACSQADPVSARAWPTSGGWSIGQLSDSCGMSQVFEGEGATQLVFLLNVDGSATLGLTNYNWSTVERQEYRLTFILNGREFSGGTAVGYRDGARKGFLTRFPPSFVEQFAWGSGLEVYNGTALVDDLSLAGTGAGVSTLRRCVAVVRAEVAAAERERARLAHIPRDPFANATEEPPLTQIDQIARPVPGAPSASAGPASSISPAHPSRRWVQLATVADSAGLLRELGRLRMRAPEVLRNRVVYTAPFGRSSARLLIGPFDNAREAQDVISLLGRSNISAFAWTSEPGQVIQAVPR